MQLTADKGWQKWQNDKMTNQTTLKEGLQLDFELGGGAWQKDDRLFNPGSLFDEEMFADEKKSKTGTGSATVCAIEWRSDPIYAEHFP